MQKKERITVTATVSDFGKRYYLPKIESDIVLLTNIRGKDGVLINEESWINVGPNFLKPGFSIGDKIMFNTRPSDNKLTYSTMFKKV